MLGMRIRQQKYQPYFVGSPDLNQDVVPSGENYATHTWYGLGMQQQVLSSKHEELNISRE